MQNNVMRGEEGLLSSEGDQAAMAGQPAPAMPPAMPQAQPSMPQAQPSMPQAMPGQEAPAEAAQAAPQKRNGEPMSREEGIDAMHQAQQKLYESPEIFGKVATAMKAGEANIEQPIAQAVFALVDTVDQAAGGIDYPTLNKIWFAMTVELYGMAKEGDLLKEKVGKEKLAIALGKVQGQFMKKYPDRINKKAMGNLMQKPEVEALLSEMGAKAAPKRQKNEQPQAAQQPQAAPAMPMGAAPAQAMTGGLIDG